MVRRMVLILTAAVVLMGVGLQTRAAETGRIRVSFGREVSGRNMITLYRVGALAGGDYALEERFGGGLIRREDVHRPELAVWLAEAAGVAETERLLDADGTAEFSRLQEGLYLIVQTEKSPEGPGMTPFLIPLPFEGCWEVQANPKTGALLTPSPETGDHPSPLIGAMGLVLSGMGLAACAEKFRRK